MAEVKEEVLIDIKLEQDEGAFKKLADLKNVLISNKNEQIALAKAFKDGVITQKEYSSEVVRLEANHKKANAQYAETQKSITGLKSPFDKLNEGLTNQTNTLSALSPALGASTNGFISMGKAIYTALIANPVTAIVIGLVAAITGLVKIFTSTEEGGDMLAKTMAQLGAIFNVLYDRAALLGGAIVKLFSGDLLGATKDLTAATSGLSDELARESKEAGELADILDKLEDRERSYKVAASATTLEIKRLIAESKNRTLSEQEKISLLEKAFNLEVYQNKKLKLIRQDEVAAAIRKIQLTTEGAKMQQRWDETILEFGQRIIDNDKIQGTERDALAEVIISYNEVQGESLVIQEKINNKIDENIIKQEEKRQKTIELMAKEDEKNKKDADEITKRLAREDALSLKLDDARTKKEVKDETARQKEIMGDMLIGNNKLLLAKQEQDINAKIAEQDEIDRNKKIEGWAKYVGLASGYLDSIFNAIQGHYKLQENELNVTLANQKTANQTAYNEEIKAIEDKFAKGELSKEDYDKAILGANQRFQAANKQAEIDQAAALNEIKRKEFEANKKNDIAQAVADGFKAALGAFAGTPGGIIIKGAAALAASIFAGIQIEQIKKTEFVPTTFGRGAVLDGPSHAHGGVMINAEGGEAVINKKNTARFLPILSAINSFDGNGVPFGGDFNPYMALGGLVTPEPSTQSNLSIESALNKVVGQINHIQTVLVIEDFQRVDQRKVQVAAKAEI